MAHVTEATAVTVDSRAVLHLAAVVPSQEVLVLVARTQAAVPSLVDHAVVVHTLVEVLMEVEVHTEVVVVTSEATDKKGYSSSIRTSAFDIL